MARGRPRMYERADIRLRISLPRKVVHWLGQPEHGNGMVKLSPAAHARVIILKAFKLVHPGK